MRTDPCAQSLRTFLFLLFILLICRLLLPSGKSFTSISVKTAPIPFLCLNSACHCLPGQFKFCSSRDARFSLLSLRARIFLHPPAVAKQTFPYMSAGFGDKPCSERNPSSESSGGRSFQLGCGILSPAPCWFFLLFSYLPNSDKENVSPTAEEVWVLSRSAVACVLGHPRPVALAGLSHVVSTVLLAGPQLLPMSLSLSNLRELMASYEPSLPCRWGAVGLLPGCNSSCSEPPSSCHVFMGSFGHGRDLARDIVMGGSRKCWPHANSPHRDRMATCFHQPGLGSGSQAADGGRDHVPSGRPGGAAPFQMTNCL